MTDEQPQTPAAPDEAAAPQEPEAPPAPLLELRDGLTRVVDTEEALAETVEKLRWEPAGTEWSDYADHTSYGDAATADKARLVDAFVREAHGERVWDLGANTGRYSRIAADAGKRVIAFDIDPDAAERGYRQIRTEGRTDILPLILDVANPSPGVGWAGRERRAAPAQTNRRASIRPAGRRGWRAGAWCRRQAGPSTGARSQGCRRRRRSSRPRAQTRSRRPGSPPRCTGSARPASRVARR